MAMTSDRSAKLTLPSDREILIERAFAAPRRRVFDAWSNRDQVPRWYGCAEMQMTEVELADLMEEVRPVKFISLDGVDEQSEVEEQSLHEIIPDDSCIAPPDALERKEVLALLAQRMEQLPAVPKKVLAMYYYENMRLSEIATCFGLTESRICQIHTQTVGQLRHYLNNLLA